MTIDSTIYDRLNYSGITAIVVTHNPRLAERMPRRLHLDKDGLRDNQTTSSPVSPTVPSTSAAPARP